MPCPICERPTETRYRPFCSKRCADVDLARWLNGAYAIPAEEDDAPDAADYDGYAQDIARESSAPGAGGRVRGGRREHG
ncbi:MAG: DNA gyrase inhibitor YacG [Pseudomonadota bacterium]|nr:DNA gyrase inhibitor YacG [Pseudomonadota bacterium]MEE3098496.1 DNA gyrase inhibitor YacG [Pseudomonadota bacterium]